MSFADDVKEMFPKRVHALLADWFRVERKTITRWLKEGLPDARKAEWERFKAMRDKAYRRARK